MAVSQTKTYAAGEVLTASDLNASLTNITDNGEDLGWPATKAKDLNGQEFILDADGDSSITVDTDDVMHLKLQGQDLFIFDGDVASVVDGITFTATATGSPPTIQASGSTTNIDLLLQGKGTGGIDINGDELKLDADGDTSLRETSDDVIALKMQGSDLFIFDGDEASAVNGFTFRGTAAGSAAKLVAQGSDTNIDVRFEPKGTGQVTVNGVQVFKRTYAKKASAQVITSGTEADITTLTALDLPTTASVDTKTFRVQFVVGIDNDTASLNIGTVKVYNGSTGDMGDTQVYSMSTEMNADATFGFAQIVGDFEFTPAAGTATKVGLSASGGGTFQVTGDSTIRITEVVT